MIWVTTKVNKKKIPVDAAPVWVLQRDRGSTFLQKDGRSVIGRKIGDAWDDDPDANMIECYESHFATCPVSNQFRNRRSEKK